MPAIKKREQKRQERKRKRDEKSETRDEVKRLRANLAKVEKALEEHRNDRRKAETDNEREAHADRIDSLRGRRRHLLRRIAQEKESLPGIKRSIRKLGKQIRHLTNRIKLSKDYASPHFRYDEFDCNDGTPVPKAAYPALERLCRDYLEPLRKKYGPVYSNSGYRHRAYNAAIGGAPYSQHIYDDGPDDVADDLTCSGASPSQVYSYLDSLGPGGLGKYATFTHVDNRPGEVRWALQ